MAVGSNMTTMVVDNFFYNGKSKTSPLVYGFYVKAVEYFKYFFTVNRFKADAVVGNRNMTILLMRGKVLVIKSHS
jgi:hypothetical protein